MDMPHSRHCGFRLLLLLSILCNVPFPSKGDSDPLVSSLNKKCSYPNIIGCRTCSQDNLMGSFFNSDGQLSEPNFNKFLDKEILSGDLCEEMLVNADIFGLSSLLRELMGEGSHRQLVTTMVFYHHPNFTHFVNEHFCEAIVIEYLPTGIFSDPFELQHLVSRGVFLSASVFGDTNLEFPSALSNISVVEIHNNVTTDAKKIVFQLPLHSRYPKCSYPNIIVCRTCSQDNLMGSFFNSDGQLSEPNFSKFLDKEILSGDFCEEMLVNADIFGLSSLLRELIGEGSHRQLVTTMVFCHHPKFTHFVNEHFCEAIVIEYLPTGVFSDPFELQHLVSRGVFLSASVFGDTNLEFPSALSNISVVEIHNNVTTDAKKIVFQLPLHSRYPPLNSSDYINTTISKPHLFIRCRPKISQTTAYSWTLIDLGVSGNTVTWKIPCGNVVHTRAVTILTFLSAIFCSFLIVLSTTYHSKDKSKME